MPEKPEAQAETGSEEGDTHSRPSAAMHRRYHHPLAPHKRTTHKLTANIMYVLFSFLSLSLSF